MLRFFFAAWAGLFLFAATLFAQAVSSWVKVSTDHFTVFSDGGEREAKTTAGQLERMHAVFARLLPDVEDDPGSHVIVFALHDRHGFEALLPSAYLQRHAMEIAGVFLPGGDRSYILLRLDSEGERPFATIYHEYTHYMLRHEGMLPLWLNEGEAEFFQNTDIDNHGVRLGEPSVNNILYLRDQTLLPLRTLFTVGRDSPFYHEDGKGNIFYAESWALTHFLSLQDFGKPHPRLQVYSDLLHAGQAPLVAAEHAFGDLSLLESQLSSYIHEGDYRALQMPLPSPGRQELLIAEHIASPEVDAFRADVLVRSGRDNEGETLAHAVLRADSTNAEADEVLGLLSLRRGNLEATKKWYGAAVQAHSDNYLAFYYFGSLTLRGGKASIPSAERSLRQSLRLNPHFAPTLESLAECDALQQDHLDEALELSLRAVSADPAALQYRLAAGEIHIARHELAAAQAVLEAALPLAHTEADRNRIQDRLREIQGALEGAPQP